MSERLPRGMNGEHFGAEAGTERPPRMRPKPIEPLDICRECPDRWPGDGHWTREPAEVEGVYVVHSPNNLTMTDGRLLTWFAVDESPMPDEHRWSIPLPEMPPVPEE